MARTLCALAWLAWLALPAAAEDGHPAHHAAHVGHTRSVEAQANLERATAALDRYRDVAAAERAGYVKPGKNDGFQMGEHWYRPELLRDPVCKLEEPQFLQYLVIDGRRTLIGTGYVCDAKAGAPDWFGEIPWHTHGPGLCRTRKGAVLDASYWAAAARAGAALAPEIEREVAALLEPKAGTVAERFLASLHVYDHGGM